MRIRKVKNGVLTEKPLLKKELFSITYRVKTITPIFGGGVAAGVADMEMPIRAAAIRGQLRYWWRFLQKNRTDGKQLKCKALFEAERAIWGGFLSDGGENSDKDYDAAGKVSVSVVTHKKAGVVNGETYAESHGMGIKYALFSAENDLLNPGVEFSLTLRAYKRNTTKNTEPNKRGLTAEQWEEVLQAVRWWANFGGVGARTRRGLGAVAVEGIAPLSKEAVEAYGCKLSVRAPVNGKAINAWSGAIDKLFQFRQGRGTGREQGSGNRPGRSYWPEPDTIRKLTECHGHPVKHSAINSFPRAMFGLPIIFELRDDRKPPKEPPKTQLLPDMGGTSRMASPLIVKPVATGNDSYIPTVLCMPTTHLDSLRLKLEVDKKEKYRLSGRVSQQFPKKFARKDSGDNAWWPLDDGKQKAKAQKIEPIKNLSRNSQFPDPLQAFLKFFEKTKGTS